MQNELDRLVIDPAVAMLFSCTRKEFAQETDPEAWPFQPATQRQIRYVYVLGKNAGYDSHDVHDFGHHHMDKGEIEELIQQLQFESGETEDAWRSEQRRRQSGLF